MYHKTKFQHDSNLITHTLTYEKVIITASFKTNQNEKIV